MTATKGSRRAVCSYYDSTMSKSMEALVDEMLADGKLTRAELKRFEAELLADGQLSIDERRQIDRLLDAISKGDVTVVDGD